MAGGYLKRALKIMLPGLTKRYELSEKACHPAVTALGMPEHRFSTLRQWKRGCLNMAGFGHWADSKPRQCGLCNGSHAINVQATVTSCAAAGPASWRQRYFNMFPEAWDVRQWFASTATYDEQRRFLRTLAPVGLISHLKSKKIPIKMVSKIWKQVHRKWLPFWIHAKSLLAPGARQGGANPSTARSKAERRSRIRHTAFRSALMELSDVKEVHVPAQRLITEFLAAAHPPSAQEQHYHDQPP